MIDDLAAIPLFADLADAQRSALASAARDVRFAAGQRIIADGQQPREWWLIRSGRVALDTTVPGRGVVTVQTLAAGDVVGWSWFVPAMRRQYGAVAIEPVAATEVDGERLRAVCEADPALGYQLTLGLLEAAVHLLHSTRARLLDLYAQPSSTAVSRGR